MDCSQPGSSVRGTLQARIPEWAAMSSLLQGIFLTQEDKINPEPLMSPALAGVFLFTTATRKAHYTQEHYL